MFIKNARRLELQIFYEEKNITTYIEKDLTDISHSDSLNEFDTLEITIQNRNLLWWIIGLL